MHPLPRLDFIGKLRSQFFFQFQVCFTACDGTHTSHNSPREDTIIRLYASLSPHLPNTHPWSKINFQSFINHHTTLFSLLPTLHLSDRAAALQGTSQPNRTVLHSALPLWQQ
jgi:hypothetical protein